MSDIFKPIRHSCKPVRSHVSESMGLSKVNIWIRFQPYDL